MTTRAKRSAKSPRIEALVSEDRELLKTLMQEALQAVLDAAMTETVGAGPGERTADRTGYRSGYYSRGLVTRIGKLELRVPRDREGRFSTELFDRYQRSEKALVSALAEMYVQGVSTRVRFASVRRVRTTWVPLQASRRLRVSIRLLRARVWWSRPLWLWGVPSCVWFHPD